LGAPDVRLTNGSHAISPAGPFEVLRIAPRRPL